MRKICPRSNPDIGHTRYYLGPWLKYVINPTKSFNNHMNQSKLLVPEPTLLSGIMPPKMQPNL